MTHLVSKHVKTVKIKPPIQGISKGIDPVFSYALTLRNKLT